MVEPLNNQFEVTDRGGEYYVKLRLIHDRVAAVIIELNTLSGDHATAAQGQLAETAYADRFKWDGSAAALANPAAGRASLQLGSAATRPSTDFATAFQGGRAETAYADRFKWDGSAAALTNPAAGRASLGLGSAATQPVSYFATAAQGALAETALQPGDIDLYNPVINLPSEVSVQYRADGRLTVISEVIAGREQTKTIAYNSDGNIQTVTTVVGAITRVETMHYANGRFTGLTATQEVGNE